MIRSGCTILIIIFLAILAQNSLGKPCSDNSHRSSYDLDSLSLLYYRSVNISPEAIDDHLTLLGKHIDKLQKRKAKEGVTEYLLQSIFFRTHQRFLKQYEGVASYEKLISEGTYNCITGSAIYVLILSSLDIPYKIFETKDHVFLMVYGNDKRYLFECTDPLNGFISDKKSVMKHVEGFSNAEVAETLLQVGSDKKDFSRFGLKKSHGLAVLAGLQYYNEAVVSYNEGKLLRAYQQALLAHKLYPCERVEVCLKTIVDAILKNDIIPAGLKDMVEQQYSFVYDH